jgi:uncharacterized protein (TIGR03435 family)
VRVVALILALFAAAQAPAPDGSAFEVASVKPSASRDTAMRIVWPRGRFSAANVTMQQFVGAAYTLPPFRIEGGPGWFNTDRFNIEAKVSADAVIVQARGMPEAIRLMTQRLLADRFMFAAHWEKKPQTIYALVKAKPDSPLGPNLQKSNVDCASLFAARRLGDPLPPIAVCGNQRAPGKLTAGSLLMTQIADTLESLLQQVVVDRTGLVGTFNVDLTWARDPTTDAGPSLFTAVQEQLGLKLEATRAPVDVLVVDRLEKPSAD